MSYSQPPAPRRRWNPNRVFFPRELRDAIPEQHRGRDLVLDSITAAAAHSLFLGPQVRLKVLAKETGRLSGEFAIVISLEPEAARALAKTLTKLADQAAPTRAR